MSLLLDALKQASDQKGSTQDALDETRALLDGNEADDEEQPPEPPLSETSDETGLSEMSLVDDPEDEHTTPDLDLNLSEEVLDLNEPEWDATPEEIPQLQEPTKQLYEETEDLQALEEEAQEDYQNLTQSSDPEPSPTQVDDLDPSTAPTSAALDTLTENKIEVNTNTDLNIDTDTDSETKLELETAEADKPEKKSPSPPPKSKEEILDSIIDNTHHEQKRFKTVLLLGAAVLTTLTAGVGYFYHQFTASTGGGFTTYTDTYDPNSDNTLESTNMNMEDQALDPVENELNSTASNQLNSDNTNPESFSRFKASDTASDSDQKHETAHDTSEPKQFAAASHHNSSAKTSGSETDKSKGPTVKPSTSTTSKSGSDNASRSSTTRRAQTNTPSRTSLTKPVKKSTQQGIKRGKVAKSPPIRRLQPTLKTTLTQHIEAGYNALMIGRFDIAERHYREAYTLAPTDTNVLLGMALIEKERGNWPAAINHYRAVLEINPSHTMAYAAFIQLTKRVNPQQMETELKSLIDATSQPSPLISFLLGNLYADQSEWTKAQNSYYQAWSGRPQDPNIAYNLAISHEQLNQYQNALRFYKRAIENSLNQHALFDTSALTLRILELEEYFEMRAGRY